MVILAFFGLVIYKENNINYRKYLYYIYLVCTVVGTLGYILVIILFFVLYDDWIAPYFDEACYDNPELYPEMYDTLEECENFIYTFAAVALVLGFVIFVPIRIMFTRVLFYGWKEQIHLH